MLRFTFIDFNIMGAMKESSSHTVSPVSPYVVWWLRDSRWNCSLWLKIPVPSLILCCQSRPLGGWRLVSQLINSDLSAVRYGGNGIYWLQLRLTIPALKGWLRFRYPYIQGNARGWWKRTDFHPTARSFVRFSILVGTKRERNQSGSARHRILRSSWYLSYHRPLNMKIYSKLSESPSQLRCRLWVQPHSLQKWKHCVVRFPTPDIFSLDISYTYMMLSNWTPKESSVKASALYCGDCLNL